MKENDIVYESPCERFFILKTKSHYEVRCNSDSYSVHCHDFKLNPDGLTIAKAYINYLIKVLNRHDSHYSFINSLLKK